jgi:hypothetical protein
MRILSIPVLGLLSTFLAFPLFAAENPNFIGAWGPTRFEENRGQFGSRTQFRAISGDGTFYLTRDGIFVDETTRDPLISFANGHKLELEGEDALLLKTNYFSGRPSSWIVGARNFSRLSTRAVYPGVDIDFHFANGQFEFDLRLAPNADPTLIKINVAPTADIKTSVDGIEVTHQGKSFRISAPVAFQMADGKKRSVPARFTRDEDGTFGVILGDYDRALPLTIDPVVAYSTYLNMNGNTGFTDLGNLVVDSGGNVIGIGSNSQVHAFIYKLNPNGVPVYISFFSQWAIDTFSAIATDAAGNAYLTGTSRYDTYPLTADAYKKTCYAAGGNYCQSGVYTKLDPAGNITYSTYFGGTTTYARDIAIGPHGDIYLAGYLTGLFDFQLVDPMVSQFTTDTGGGPFIVKFDPSGTSIHYATLLGSGDAKAIAVNSADELFVTGRGGDPSMELHPVTQHQYEELFLVKIKSDGSGLLFGTLFGGTPDLQNLTNIHDMTLDTSGAPIITGTTWAADLPVTTNALRISCEFYFNPNAFPPTQCYPSGYVIRFAPDGSAITYGSYLGRSGFHSSIASTPDGGFVTAIMSYSAQQPLLDPVQKHLNTPGQIYLSQFSASGDLTWASYLGGLHGASEQPKVAVHQPSGTIFVAAASAVDPPLVHPSTKFPNAVFVTKIIPGSGSALSVSPLVGDIQILQNLGTVPISFTSMTGLFNTPSSDCGATLPPAEFCAVFAGVGNRLTINHSAGQVSEFIGAGQGVWLPIVRPTSIDFGLHRQGEQSVPRSFTISNPFGFPIPLSVSAPTSPAFLPVNNCPAVLAAGQRCTIDVTYTAGTQSLIGATMTLSGTIGGLSGQLLDMFVGGSSTAEKFVLSFSRYDFGRVQLGQSRTQVLSISNTGNAALPAPQVQIPAPFLSTTNCNLGVPARGACWLKIDFPPSAVGLIEKEAKVTAAGVTRSLTLVGTGIPISDLQADYYDLVFFPSYLHHPHSSVTLGVDPIQLTNQSDTPLTIDAVSASTGFLSSHDCPTELAPRAHCMVTVQTSPEQIGPYFGQLTIASSGSGSPLHINLSGEGRRLLDVSTFPMNTNVTIGQSQALMSISLGNSQSEPIPLKQITVSGQGFSTTKGFCASVTTIAIFTGCNFLIDFKPTHVGAHSGSVTIDYSDVEGPVTIPLAGNGIDLALSLSRPGRPRRNGTANLQATKTFEIQAAFLGGRSAPLSLSCPDQPNLECEFQLLSESNGVFTYRVTASTRNVRRSIRLGRPSVSSVRIAANASGYETRYMDVTF